MIAMIFIAGLLAAIAGAALLALRRMSATKAQAERDAAARALEAERAIAAATAEAASLRAEASALRERLSDAESRVTSLTDRLMDAEGRCAAAGASLRRFEEERGRNDEMLRSQFANLATEILNSNSSRFKAESEEHLSRLLNPLRDNIDDFRKAVTEAYTAEARERFSLEKAIASLVNVNDTISREARELTQALKGNNAVQGEWGEMVLESILEKSGLIRGEEYFVQSTRNAEGETMIKEDGGVMRPDVVVRYPDGRCVVIDSKVSLKAFLEYANTDDRAVAKSAGDRHVASVRSHVDKLSRKKYQDFIGADQLDFVMMFIPNEPAYMAAMRLDGALWQYAYDRGVLIVSPTHLVSGLRLIAQLWSRDKVTRNAIRISEDAGKMYDKFVEFVNDMEKIDKALASAQKTHAEAMKKLSTGRGALVKRASDLKALGIKASKQLNMTADEDPSPLSDTDTGE